MSCEPPVSGRVSAIKSQFESLSGVDSLDISGCRTKKQSVRFQFQRAATSFDLLNRNGKTRDPVHSWSLSAANNGVPKQSSDSALIEPPNGVSKQPAVSNRSALKRSSKETTDVKLSRHTSDPVKRSSIKRSPAFRIGEKQNKTVLVKQTSLSEDSEPGDKKFEKFISRNCCKENMERLQQAGLTDSLKAALRQPLPTGPPPKKPPRTFYGSPTSSDQKPLMDPVEENEPCEPASSSVQIQDKINFLETNLALKNGPKTHLPAVKTRSPLLKSKTELMLQGTKFLNCISCHRDSTPVYDSVDTTENESKPLLLQKSRLTCPGRKQPEHIYMEPFGHLKSRASQETSKCSKLAQETDKANTNTNGSSSPASASCTCPENHKSTDSHYLCTAINDNSDNTDKETNISLEKTYDEISILLNAAFQQKVATSDNISMTSKNSDDNESRNSTKLSRSLTEKRKDYVRRVSIVPSSKLSTYGTVHRTFKPSANKISTQNDDTRNNNESILTPSDECIIKTSDRINKYKQLCEESSSNTTSIPKMRHPKQISKVDGNNDDDDENEEMNECDDSLKLFQVCILAGYNTFTSSAYVKFKYPPNEPIPDNIEQLVFPSSELIKSGKENQEYCLILTDDNGFKVYGYCRRILPEKSEMCLPLAYCIVSVTKALGFYQKLLKEIESRHGQSETQLKAMLRNIQNAKIPNAGKYLHVKLPLSLRPKPLFSSNHKISPKRLSLEANPKWLTESATQAAFADFENDSKSGKRSSGKSLMEEFENKKQQAPFDLSLINRSLIARDPRFDEILIRRPNDLRLENAELSDILECLGPDVLINIFASLLHERKVILQGKNISLISKAILALDTILYPFQWQYTIVTILPHSLIEICQAPFPVLVGVLDKVSFEIEDGILVDMDLKQIVQCCGDEQIIIPDSLRKSLQLSLEMVDLIDQGKMLSSVLISESFLRFFIELFADMNLKRFQKDDLIQSHQKKDIKFFLEWFLETSMFRHFYNARYNDSDPENGKNNYFNLFDARLMEKSQNKGQTSQNIETIVKNSKIINKKGKTFRDRFKQFLS